MRSGLPAIAALLGLLGAWPAAAADCSVPAPGTAERKAVMDAVRQPVAKELRQPVEFVAHKFKACASGGKSFAFLDAEPQKPGGAALDWSITPYAEDDCSRLVIALMVKDAAGPWRVEELNICPTDVPWEVWPEQYGAPAELFAEDSE